MSRSTGIVRGTALVIALLIAFPLSALHAHAPAVHDGAGDGSPCAACSLAHASGASFGSVAEAAAPCDPTGRVADVDARPASPPATLRASDRAPPLAA